MMSKTIDVCARCGHTRDQHSDYMPTLRAYTIPVYGRSPHHCMVGRYTGVWEVGVFNPLELCSCSGFVSKKKMRKHKKRDRTYVLEEKY